MQRHIVKSRIRFECADMHRFQQNKTRWSPKSGQCLGRIVDIINLGQEAYK